jgi:hypothetical protein
MLNSDWGPIAEHWKAQLTAILRTPTEAANTGAPATWCEYLGEGGITRLQEAWASDRAALPLFNAYLQRDLDDIAVGMGASGHVLLYRFRDWVDDGDGFLPGVMVAGVPASASAVARVETLCGGLSPGLRAVWSRHGYVELKNGTILSRPETAMLHHTSTQDYLAIVNSGSSMPTCVRRAQSEPWTDDVFLFEPGNGKARVAPSLTVDALLVDWATVRWPPEDYIDM